MKYNYIEKIVKYIKYNLNSSFYKQTKHITMFSNNYNKVDTKT